jgi:predicted TIM-barrel fold metal-dependent hydrolase
MRAATEWGVLKKLMFGSDYPYAAPQETLDGLRRVNDLLHGTVLPPVPLDEIEAIIHRDSLSLLGLD